MIKVNKIIVSFDEETIELSLDEAKELFEVLSKLINSKPYGGNSFLINSNETGTLILDSSTNTVTGNLVVDSFTNAT